MTSFFKASAKIVPISADFSDFYNFQDLTFIIKSEAEQEITIIIFPMKGFSKEPQDRPFNVFMTYFHELRIYEFMSSTSKFL